MKYILVGLVLLVAACGGYANPALSEYSMPAESKTPEYFRTLNKSYDDVWHSVINYVSATSFAIDDFEKESGLITLTFGQSDISKYVDCGQLNITKHEYNTAGFATKMKFEGSYTDYLVSYSDATLSGKMNISVREVSENKSWLFFGDDKTYVRANVLYILRASPLFSSFSYTWNFVSGSSDIETRGYDDTINYGTDVIKCQPTYFLEKSILDAATAN